jgi:predicted ribosomally synthesized peptide with nif11-like leader
MTRAQVLAFIERLAVDKELQLKVGAATNSSQVIKFAQEAGFDFTIEEFRSTALHLPTANRDELTDGELKAVSGGEASPHYGDLITRIIGLPDC